MIISLARLGVDERHYEGTLPGAILELEGEEFVRVQGDVRYDLRVNLVGGELVVRGKVEADMSFVCVRCAELFPLTVSDSSFVRVKEVHEKTECVDLTEDIRESIILAFAMNPVCDPGCKGLCTQCGANLNKKKCKCAPPAGDDRWGALNELRVS